MDFEETRECRACGERRVIWDSDEGDVVCEACGVLYEDIQLSTEPSFLESRPQASSNPLYDPLSVHSRSRLHSVRGAEWHLHNNLVKQLFIYLFRRSHSLMLPTERKSSIYLKLVRLS
ncbi:hypothetical protein FRC14_004907 [Serendipita sp. 396]|nr:hypothetical protein FRC14_004907 [Serendipita sp. 396]